MWDVLRWHDGTLSVAWWALVGFAVLVVIAEVGLADGQPRSLDEIARVYGVTRERVRHVEATALAKLRNPLPAGILRAS